MSLLSETFATTRAEGRAALVGYLPAGFPSAAEAVAVVAADGSHREGVRRGPVHVGGHGLGGLDDYRLVEGDVEASCVGGVGEHPER